jgi:hypothetical protein
MFKPFGERVMCKIGKRYIFDAKNKPVLDDSGNPVYEQEQEGTVISSNIPEIKKGMKIIPLGRGGVPIIKEENKKGYVVIFDYEDIYAVE